MRAASADRWASSQPWCLGVHLAHRHEAWGDVMNYEVGGWGANVNTLTVGPG